jgi:GTP-binding protein Era
VGKSTLLNALLGERLAITSRHPQTTRELVRGVLTLRDTQYVFVDTPGLHAPRNRLGQRMNRASLHAAREADVVVLLAETPRDDVSRAPSAPATPRFDADIAAADELATGRAPCVLVVTKIDRLKDKSALLPLMEAASRGRDFTAVVPVSAKKSDGIRDLLEVLREHLPEQPFLFEEDTLTDQPTRFFVAEYVREQVLAKVSQEVPHGVAVVVEAFDEAAKVHRITLTVHVAREAHKKILVGAGGRMMKAIGSAARARVEELLGRQVHLEIWVRATPGWMDDEARLRELGYDGPGLRDR